MLAHYRGRADGGERDHEHAEQHEADRERVQQDTHVEVVAQIDKYEQDAHAHERQTI